MSGEQHYDITYNFTKYHKKTVYRFIKSMAVTLLFLASLF